MTDTSKTTVPATPAQGPGGSQPAAATTTASVAAGQQRAQEQKAADDRAHVARGAAAEAATSVADAVKRVADAAVAEVQKSRATGGDGDFIFSGTPGGRFRIDGPVGSFSTNGTVKLNGVQLHTRAWSSMRIEGDLPAGSQPGEVTVAIDEKTVRRGYAKF